MVGPLVSYDEFRMFIKAENDYYLKNSAIDYMGEFALILGGIISSLCTHHFVDFTEITTMEYNSRSFLSRVYYIYIFTLFKRLRFISAWGFTHLSILLCGLREYNGKDLGKPLRNFNFMKQEFSTTARQKINNWNLGISKWLRSCFYNKFLNLFEVDKNSATLYTFIFSAFWHGYYPSYYISFFFWQILLRTERYIYKLNDVIKAYFSPIILNIYLMFLFNVIGVVFLCLGWDDTVQTFLSLKYWLLSLVVMYFVFQHLEAKHRKQMKKSQENAKEKKD